MRDIAAPTQSPAWPTTPTQPLNLTLIGSTSLAYLTKVLRPDERVLFHGSLHWLIYARGLLTTVAGCAVLIAGLLTSDPVLGRSLAIGSLAVFLTAAVMLILAGIRRQTVEFVVTDKRVIYKTGLVTRHTAEINISKVESVDVDQGILGRIFGFGTVLLRGTGASMEPLRNVADPIGLRNAILVG